MAYLKTIERNGTRHTVECCGDLDGKAYYIVDGTTPKEAKLHYRHERTWDDHMGNTPCGLYFVAQLPGRTSARCYLSEFPIYR